MIRFPALVTSVFCAVLFSFPGTAQDLAKYRDFQFGMSLESVAKQLSISAAEAKTTHQRPDMIQTLRWDQFRYPGSAAKTGSIRNIRFDFFKDELFKIVVTYDSAGTVGLTTDDMIEALSAIYGPAAKPQRTIAVTAEVYEDNHTVLACWEDAEYSYNLFRFSYGSVFGLAAFSRKLDLLASDSIREAERLDKLEAPGKELARQIRLEEDKRAAEEKARLISKPKFRP